MNDINSVKLKKEEHFDVKKCILCQKGSQKELIMEDLKLSVLQRHWTINEYLTVQHTIVLFIIYVHVTPVM